MRLSFSLPGISIGLSVLVFLLLLPTRLSVPASFTFANDAQQYNALAVNLAEYGSYSLDGVTPFFEREPGFSVFLAGIYAIFGAEQRGVFFIIQGLLYLAAAILFWRELRHAVSRRAADITLLLLLTFPAAFHVVFSPLREALALSAFLLFSAAFLRLASDRRCWRAAIGGGIALGWLIITYIPYLLFPPFVLLLGWWLGVRWRHLLALLMIAMIPVAVWGVRNQQQVGMLCLTGCHRGALAWYVRGEQAETIRGMEPFRCLYAEYVSRDWEGLDPNCSFNAVWHRKWPEDFHALPEDAAAGEAGIAKIKAHPIAYLWFSLVDVLELHIPYVNGWGIVYNLLAVLGSVVSYIGVALWVVHRRWRKVEFFFLCAMLYTTGVFVLTDATPRYLLPVTFAYAALAGIGYDWLLSKVWKK